MIIPSIDVLDSSATNDLDSICEQLSRWSLFGQIAVRNIAPEQVPLWVSVAARVAGSVSLHVELAESNEQAALELLNAGAAALICDAAAAADFTTIPRERTRQFLIDDQSDQAVPANHWMLLETPTASRMAELEMARIDCLVAIRWLEDSITEIGDFFEQILVSDRPDGLWPTVIVDPLGIALGLAYSNRESLEYAIQHRVGSYYSRSREELWIKGETSGATQKLHSVRIDCDRDCLQFGVFQAAPGFCHRQTYTCFGQTRTIQTVIHRLQERIRDDDESSFTHKLARDPQLLQAKLIEEARELSQAAQLEDQHAIAWEAADVLYFSLVAMLKRCVSLDQVYNELNRRMNRLVRRPNKLEPEDQS